MRDPHVVALRYVLRPSETVPFENPPPVEHDVGKFRLRLEDNVLTINPKEHFSVSDARNVVDDYLRAWELDVALRYGRHEITFTFEDAEVIDRDPPPPGSAQIIAVPAIATAEAFGSVTIHVTRHQYPEPPKDFRVSPDVETLWRRYEDYLNKREPLLSMAYFCLTVLEAKAGTRENAAKTYRIHQHVLRNLGELTSEMRGDERTARKFKHGVSRRPLSSAETRWIEAVIKTIIRRVGEIDTNPSLPIITLSNLPHL